LLYNLTVLQVKKKQLVKQHQKVGAVWWRRVWFKVSDAHMEKATGMFFMGMALLILASDMLVRIAERIAVILNLPTIIIGMILIAVGTSLPELSFEIAAIRKKEVEMALGNILGSVVANSTLILGVTVLLSPITLNDGIRPYLVATLSFITAFSLFWIFVRSKKQLDRWEGLILLLVFLLFVVFEFFKLQNGFSF
jgi:cation:H+ antiporter